MPKSGPGRSSSSTGLKTPRSASTGRVQKSKQTTSVAIAKVDGIDPNLLHPDYRPRSPIVTRNMSKAAQQQPGEGTSSGTTSGSNIPTSNKFDLLSDEDLEVDDDDDGSSKADGDLEPGKAKVCEQNKKQPTIHIPNTPWERVVNLMNRNNCEYATKLCKSSVQLHTMSRSMFEEVQRVLKAGGVEYFTFDSPQSKPVKIVLSGYMAEPVEDLKKDLADYDISPREIKILSKKQTTAGEHVLYLLFFDRGSFKIQDLRRIKNVYGYLVHWRYFTKRPNDAAQCHRCQRFGHGSRNCTLSPKCVKCGASHLTENCTLPRKTALQQDNNAEQNKPLVKCSNCSGNHTANYRGCPSRKTYLEEIEKRKKKPVSRLPAKPSASVPAGPTDNSAHPPGWGRSYANVAASAGGASSAPDAAADGNLFTMSEFLCLARDMFQRLSGCRSKQQQFLALGELMMKYIGN